MSNTSADSDTVVLRWTRHPHCVALARQELRALLRKWELSTLEDAATLVLSELLTNAGRHAGIPGREIETRYLARKPGGLRIEVHDTSERQPVQRTPEPDACEGRGLILVAALADTWGISHRTGPGKLVWAEWNSPTPPTGSE
ncbi:ATP-binding protein [Streptomyces hebeiensis]